MITAYNITLADADTEYAQMLPPGTFAFQIQCRTPDAFRMAFVPGKVADSTAPYITVKSGTVYSGRFGVGGMSVYVARGAGLGALVAELIVFHS